jgi:hypothetical protein
VVRINSARKAPSLPPTTTKDDLSYLFAPWRRPVVDRAKRTTLFRPVSDDAAGSWERAGPRSESKLSIVGRLFDDVPQRPWSPTRTLSTSSTGYVALIGRAERFELDRRGAAVRTCRRRSPVTERLAGFGIASRALQVDAELAEFDDRGSAPPDCVG